MSDPDALMPVQRVAETRVRLELQTLGELADAVAALFGAGMPGSAEVSIDCGSFGPPHLVARYWPDGEDDGEDDEGVPDEPIKEPADA